MGQLQNVDRYVKQCIDLEQGIEEHRLLALYNKMYCLSFGIEATHLQINISNPPDFSHAKCLTLMSQDISPLLL